MECALAEVPFLNGRSCLFRFFKALAQDLSSPSMGVNASSGMPSAINLGVVPNRLFPHFMWWSKNDSGFPGSIASIQRLTLQSSTAIGLRSTP